MRTPQRIARGLRTARRQSGRTQAATASAAGVSREALSLLENGRRGARVDTLNAVLDVLGYEIAFLPRTEREQQMRDSARSYQARRQEPQ